MKILLSGLLMILSVRSVLAGEEVKEGKVFVKTEPAGAAIFVTVRDGEKTDLKDTGKKTAALVMLPQGRQTVVLRLDGYEDATLEIGVDPAAIAKPDAVKLARKTVSVDIIFEDGWAVCDASKKQLLDAKGKPGTTPCTLELPSGAYEIVLVKDGFADIKQKVEIKTAGQSVEITGKPVKSSGKPTPITVAGRTADRIVVWNTHGIPGDRGTAEFDIILLNEGKKVHEEKGIKPPWRPSGDNPSKVIFVPPVTFDTVRIEITKWHKNGAGLSEVEVWNKTENLALKGTATASGVWDENEPASAAIDGNTKEEQAKKGYTFWILPNASTGWIEITLPKAAKEKKP